MIRKLGPGKYRNLTKSGRNMGTSRTRAGAVKRLHEIEWFKRHPKSAGKKKTRKL